MNNKLKSLSFLLFFACSLISTKLEAAYTGSIHDYYHRFATYHVLGSNGSTLRPARVLECGELELSAGVLCSAYRIGISEFDFVYPTVVAAYGIYPNIEIEARAEDGYFAFSPRFQIGKSESAFVDSLIFCEAGYNDELGFQWGVGAEIGRRFNSVEPYISYRLRNYVSLTDHQAFNHKGRDYLGVENIHYLRAGSRFHLPKRWISAGGESARWFVGIEAGPTFFSREVLYEVAANVGLTF